MITITTTATRSAFVAVKRLASFRGVVVALSMSKNSMSPQTKAKTTLDDDYAGSDGSFQRNDAAWRKWISSEEGAQFQPEKDRYHLYVAYGCPWAHRTLITRALKGLEDVISTTIVMPIWQRTNPSDPEDKHYGWMFSNPGGEPIRNAIGLGGPFPASYPENEPDPFFGAKSVREIYEKCGDTLGIYSVPILYDKKLKTIVNNESSEIIQMLNKDFNGFATKPELELAPEDLKSAMEEVDKWIYPTINNGVYRCGFAKNQRAYETALGELTESFDRIEKILMSQRYIAGDRFTLSDIRLFVTLLRFDECYHNVFKTNTRTVAGSPVILNYIREIYQMPGVKETVNMKQIKELYFCGLPDLNKLSIIAKGPNFEGLLQEPHNRDGVKA